MGITKPPSSHVRRSISNRESTWNHRRQAAASAEGKTHTPESEPLEIEVEEASPITGALESSIEERLHVTKEEQR
ncbi:hypothetical protein HN51_043658 [Arachis hypogaea]